jgi:alpha-beta hydrolase superfamily lysophospholipase
MGLNAACVSLPDLGNSEAALAVEDILAGQRDSRLKQTTSTPSFRDVHYELDGRRYEASLFTPAEPPAGTIIFIPGLHKDGRHQHQVGSLGRTLARLRFVVLVPDLVEMRALQVAASNVQDVSNAIRYLRNTREIDTGSRLGIIGISYGAGPAVLAAADPGVAAEVDFVVTLGGYYDLRHVVRYSTTGFIVEPSTGRLKKAGTPPGPDNRWYFALGNLGKLSRARDREAVRKYVMSRFRRGIFSDWIDRPPENLAPDAAALLAVTENSNPARVMPLLASLSEPIRRRLRLLDPSRTDLSCLSAEVMLIHGHADQVIPVAESQNFASKVKRSRLFLLEQFGHIRFKSLGAAGQLVPMLEYLLERRDQPVRPIPSPSGCIQAAGKANLAARYRLRTDRGPAS